MEYKKVEINDNNQMIDGNETVVLSNDGYKIRSYNKEAKRWDVLVEYKYSDAIYISLIIDAIWNKLDDLGEYEKEMVSE